MPPPKADIACCRACGQALDVTALPPFDHARCPTCGESTQVKTQFGAFRLERRHAVGGMSVVFFGRDETLGREVALKILNEADSADERRISAFEEEARLTASFTHPHVVRLYTTGRAFGRFFIAMEWVPGGHLEQRIASRGRLPEREVLPLAIQVAEGLMAAHAAGLIHRDIKPGNILFDAAGDAKIVDFGLALMTQGGTARAQERWATPCYVPPEAVEGHEEDFRSDMYAFGATLYHALAGVPPCQEETMDSARLREAKRKIAPLAEVAPWLSSETCAVVDRAMAYEPRHRFSSYAEMLGQLRYAAEGAAEPRSEQTPRHARRRRLRARWLALGTAGVLLAALAIAGRKIADPPSERPTVVAGKPAPPPDSEPPASAATVIDAERESATEIAGRYREARAHLVSGRYEKARQTFAQLRDDPHVREPTRSGSAVEAVLASFLAGDAGQATADAALAAAHVAEALPEGSPLRAVVHPLLSQVGDLKPIVVEMVSPVDRASQVLAAMLAALNNWEQGQLDLAEPYLAAVAGAQLPAEDEWAVVYVELATDYLADHAILTSPLFDDYPATRAETEAAISALNEASDLLETRGRGPFNVRSWQLDLTRHASRLAVAEAKAAAVPDVEASLAKLEAMRVEWQFSEASAFLRSLPRNVERLPVDSWLALYDAADGFLDALEQDIQTLSRGQATLERRDGGTVGRLSVGNRRQLWGTTAAGEPGEFSWSDFTTGSINALYRALVGRHAVERERLNRHEDAIAFEWLVGDRPRAAAAAERLGREYPLFGLRWEKLMSALAE